MFRPGRSTNHRDGDSKPEETTHVVSNLGAVREITRVLLALGPNEGDGAAPPRVCKEFFERLRFGLALRTLSERSWCIPGRREQRRFGIGLLDLVAGCATLRSRPARRPSGYERVSNLQGVLSQPRQAQKKTEIAESGRRILAALRWRTRTEGGQFMEFVRAIRLLVASPCCQSPSLARFTYWHHKQHLSGYGCRLNRSMQHHPIS